MIKIPAFLLFKILAVLLVLTTSSCKPDAPNGQVEATTTLPDPAADYETNPYQWGFIDTRGKIAIADRYDEVRPFEQGLALVRKNGHWGYINTQGKFVIENKFRAAWPFVNQLAKAQSDDDLFGFINRRGDWVIPATFEDISVFSEGLACFRKEQVYGFIDTAGNEVIPPQYERSSRFQDGLAIVSLDGKYGMIDRAGQLLIPIEFTKLKPFSEGLARAQQDKKYGFIDQQGKWIIAPTFDQAEDFNGHLAAVAKNGQWGIITTDGTWQVEPQFQQINYVGEQRWLITSEAGRFNLIDQEGNQILAKNLDEIHHFSNGIAAFRDGELWGYMASDGRIISPPQYFLAWPFMDGLARVASDNGLSYIDTAGFLLIAPQQNYIELRDFSEGLAPVQVYR